MAKDGEKKPQGGKAGGGMDGLKGTSKQRPLAEGRRYEANREKVVTLKKGFKKQVPGAPKGKKEK